MECSTPLKYDPDKLKSIFNCCYLPKLSEYSLHVASYPGTNCNSYWGLEGNFFATLNIYQHGKLALRYHTPVIDQNEAIVFDCNKFLNVLDQDADGLAVAQYHHAKGIPIDLYASYTHKESNTYVSLPMSTFMGDTIYEEWHSSLMENAVFWPGVPSTEDTESCVIIPNPYKVNLSYEIWLYAPDGNRFKSDVKRTKAYTSDVWRIEEVFPEQVEQLRVEGNAWSLGITAQYKVISFFSIRNRKDKMFTTVDHLHSYGLY